MTDDTTTFRATRYLPQVMIATAIVAGLPVGVVWVLRAEGVVSSPWLCALITIGLSLAASVAGHSYWKRRPGSGDLLFSELLLWGWLRRLRIERQLDRANEALGLNGADADHVADRYTVAQRLELLGHLAAAMEAHDPYVEGHSRRVARHATGVARKLGLTSDEVQMVARAAAVHDVGKLRLPREVLMKPGALTDEEFEIIKRHSTEGAQMVDCLGDPELTAIVRHHHERLDGTGYPAGLVGDEIPLGARIIAVADTFDAITSTRPYRPAARHKQAIDIMTREAGAQLDASVVRAFVGYYSGRRILALWALLGAAPQRALAAARRVAGTPAGASAAPTAAVTVTTAAATIAIGAAAIVPPVAGPHPSRLLSARHGARTGQLASILVTSAPKAASLTGAGPATHAVVHRARVRRQFDRASRRPVPAASPVLLASLPVAPAPYAPPSSGPAPAAAATTRPSSGTPPTVVNRPAVSGTGAPPAAPADTSSTPPAPPPASPSTNTTPDAASSAGATTPTAGSPATTPTGDTTGGSTGGSTGGGTGGGGTGGGSGGGTGGGSGPTTVADCQHDAWIAYGTFHNQGDCVSYVVGSAGPAAKP